MTRISSEALSKIDELQVRYIAALDAKNMDGWLNTFSTDRNASYICTTAENHDANRPLALIMDDCHARLKDRVSFVTKVWVGTYTDYRTRHFIQRTSCREVDNGQFEVETNFSLTYTPADTGRAEVFTTGVYLDRIKVDGDEASFLSKKVITDTAVLERYLVFPL
ncbi:MAG: hypothetical protein JWQ23_2066 [Herminiimonas sp.]|nr:hypothetical protein [Herminiimonas sp.]